MINADSVSDLHIGQNRIAADQAVLADGGFSEQLHERFDDCVGADGDSGIDDDRLWFEDRDTVVHEVAGLALAQDGIELREFAASVDAEDFAGMRSAQGQDWFAVVLQDGGDLGEVELSVRVVGGELVDTGEEVRDVEGVDAGVDFADLFLGRCELLLLDDGVDVIGAYAVDDAAHDASVAEWIGGLGGEDGHRRGICDVEVAYSGNRFRSDERHVSAENQDVVVFGECLTALHECVSGAALLLLLDELRSERAEFGAHAFGFMADDAEDVGGRNDVTRCTDNVAE